MDFWLPKMDPGDKIGCCAAIDKMTKTRLGQKCNFAEVVGGGALILSGLNGSLQTSIRNISNQITKIQLF